MNSTQSKIISELNAQQKEPVINYKEPSVVFAGAGAGKTKTMVSRVAYMIEDGIAPENIVFFTFTRKAANEIKERVKKFIGSKADGMFVGTYHSFCAKLLRKYMPLFSGYSSNFAIYDEEDKKTIIKDAMEEFGADSSIKIEAVMAAISHWKERLITPEMIDCSYGSMDYIMKGHYEIYQRKLREMNALDFSDLMIFMIRLMESNASIKKQINDKYQWIIADEFQDSSVVDLRFLQLLSNDCERFCGCGDNSQSIYSFRGTNLNEIIRFVGKYNLKQFIVGQNYRSTSTIVDSANRMIKRNHTPIQYDCFTQNAKGEKAVVIPCAHEEEEATKISAAIKSINSKGIEYKEIAVLYRSNFLSRAVEKGLMSAKIPYRIMSGTPFYSRKEVKDVMCVYRVLNSTKDVVALSRALMLMGSIGAVTINKIKKLSIWKKETLTHKEIFAALFPCVSSAKGKTNLKKFFDGLEELKTHGTNPIDIFTRILILLDYETVVKKGLRTEDDYKRRISTLRELKSIVQEYSSIDELVMNITSVADSEEEPNAVSLMTVHGSKGLEYRVVIVVGCNEGVFPSGLSLKDNLLEEERRIFYVAMTRAKEFLIMTYCQGRIQNGRFMPAKESRFLNEIDSNYLLWPGRKKRGFSV